MGFKRVSEAVIRRLPRYYRHLTMLETQGVERISSERLARQMNLNASQVRQDFNCFGGFGQQGYGYNVSNLTGEIKRIMGIDRKHTIIIVGAGNIGHALTNFPGFAETGFEVKALFDVNEDLIGTEIKGHPVLDVKDMDEYIRENQIDIGVIAARRSAALARSLDGCETGGKTVETVTWAAIDEGGNVEVAVTNSPASAPSGGTTADVVNGSGGHVISDGVWSSDGVHDSGYEQNAGTVTDSAGGKIEAGSKTETDESDKKDSGKAYETKADDSGSKADSKKSDSKGSTASQASGDSQSSGSSSAQSQKKWVPEQGHWETDYGQVWVPNVVYVRHERYWVNHGGTKVGPFDSKAAAWSWCDNDVDNGGIGGSVIDDSYTTSEDQGHYEQQATGRHWVVDVAGHWE